MTQANTREQLLSAIRDYIAAGDVPLTEFNPEFIIKMISAMMVSFHKYGRVADAYPLKFNAASDVRARMSKYRATGNMHFLVDAANFAMIEAMHPAPERNATWGTNDAADSPGRTTASGPRLTQEDNSGSRIIGETILSNSQEPDQNSTEPCPRCGHATDSKIHQWCQQKEPDQ